MNFYFADEQPKPKRLLSEQQARILQQLSTGDYLHILNCHPKDCHKLATRIGELRNKHGYEIEHDQWHEYTNADGKKVRVKKYRLIAK